MMSGLKLQDSGENVTTTSTSVSAVVLAAGMGTRMKSNLPKVLHKVCGKPMVSHVVDALKASGVGRVGLVLSEQLSDFEDILTKNPELEVCIQKDRRGTGDAVASSAAFFEGVEIPGYAQLNLHKGAKASSDHIIICAGDTPALSTEVVAAFLKSHIESDASVSVIGMELDDPSGYGRLVMTESGALTEIVEHKDASSEQLKINACNTGVIAAKSSDLFKLLSEVTSDNAQNEYYLTDIIGLGNKHGLSVQAFLTKNWQSFMGVNTPEQKEVIETYMSSLA